MVAAALVCGTLRDFNRSSTRCCCKGATRERANKIFLDSFKRLGFKLGVLNASDCDFSRVYTDNSYVVYAFPDFYG
jgi:hypothetical protein